MILHKLVMAALLLGSMRVYSFQTGLSMQRAGAKLFAAGQRRTYPSMSLGTGHQHASKNEKSSGNGSALSPEDAQKLAAFRTNQENAARISFAEEVRTLIHKSNHYGVLSTNSVSAPGYPTGSVVGFQLDAHGLPFMVFSSMSAHTKDVREDGRVSLTILAEDFKGAAEGRVVMVGNVVPVTDNAQIAELRELYLARHHDAYWVDFGDFSYFRMETLQGVRFVGGFAMAGSLTPEEYSAAAPDPLSIFATPVMAHMNVDHSDSTAAMVRHYAGVECSAARIVGIDRLGLTVCAHLDIMGGGEAKVRLPFPREVTERKAVKEAIVEMTRAAANKSDLKRENNL